MKIKLAIITLFASLAISCQSQNSESITNLSVKEFAEKLKQNKNEQLLDVRTPDEFGSDKIYKSVNNDILSTEFESKSKDLDKTKPVFVYCKAGSRSAKAAEKLEQLGFKVIYNLEGGIMKWNASEISKSVLKTEGISVAEYNKILKNNSVTIINFYAKWCEPCKKMEPYILKLQAKLKDKIPLVRLDADQNKTIIENLKLDGLPVILIYEKQKEVYRHLGYLSENDLLMQLKL